MQAKSRVSEHAHVKVRGSGVLMTNGHPSTGTTSPTTVVGSGSSCERGVIWCY